MVRLFLISGFNPFDKDSFRIDKYYKDYTSPRKKNWTKKDVEYAIAWYNTKYGNDPYVLSCHSDGGTIAHQIAHSDTRCIGLHCHSAFFTKEKYLRDIPVLFTTCCADFTGMGLVTRLAYRYYKDRLNKKPKLRVIKKSSLFRHSYGPCIPTFTKWCKKNFNFYPEPNMEKSAEWT